jgi:putative PIN family toxin of toxin-antitoxin system
LVSKPIIQEVLGVLARKFTRDREELARVAAFLADAGELVAATYRADALTDEADNRILECAVSGKADAIVTGDRAMLRLGQYADISIITLRDFLER